MINVKVRIKKFHNAKSGIEDGAENGVRNVLNALVRQSKAFSPVDKGVLRASVKKEQNGVLGRVFTLIRYAIFQELGTSRMMAANQGKGFFQPAADIIRNKSDSIMGRAIRKALRRN